MTTVEQNPREALIADLRAFADLLDRRPDLPVGSYVHVQYSVIAPFGDEAARIAEVERVAVILGVDVDRDVRRAEARLPLGRVEYVVHTTTDLGDVLYDANRSYDGAVEPAGASS